MNVTTEIVEHKEPREFPLHSLRIARGVAFTINKDLRTYLGITGKYSQYNVYIDVIDECRLEIVIVPKDQLLRGYPYRRSVYEHWRVRLPRQLYDDEPKTFKAVVSGFNPPKFILHIC